MNYDSPGFLLVSWVPGYLILLADTLRYNGNVPVADKTIVLYFIKFLKFKLEKNIQTTRINVYKSLKSVLLVKTVPV
jgi:hypothetical protein